MKRIRRAAAFAAALLLLFTGAAAEGTEPAAPAAQAQAAGGNLRKGSKGDEVTQLQERLQELGYLDSKPDGIFGNDTVSAVKAFQRRNGLSADGQAGPLTQERLYAEDAVAAPEIVLTDTLEGELPMLVNKKHMVEEYFQPADLVLLTEVLDSGITRKEIWVVPEKIIADVTKTDLMNNFGLISAYSTQTTKNNNRNTNIKLSAEAINGRTVQPGEIFSFNGATGERTAAKGYKEAPAIAGGQSKDEVGGGVCQTSSTLFNAVVRADLEIVERNPHAWPSSYIEKGFDATVNWPGLDMKFRNNTDQPIFIVAGYSNRQVTVNIYGMSLGPGVKIDLESELVRTIPQPEGINYVVNTELAPGEQKKTVTGRKGYEVNTWKIWYNGNREVRRELLFKTTYKAYQETVEYNPQ